MNKFYLRKMYFKLEMEEGQEMWEHIKKMKELSDQLSVIGDRQSEGDKVCHLVTILLLRRSLPIWIRLILNRSKKLYFMNEEQKRKSRTSSGDSALVGKETFNPTCYVDGKVI